MNDATAALAGHTKKYNIPLSHFEHKYIQNCTNGKELERIYKELISGEIGAFPALEQLTLDRIRDIKPNSQILRQDKAPLDKSALPDDERRQFDEFLNQMKEPNRTSSSIANDHQNNGIDSIPIRSKSTVSKTISPASSASVINSNGKQKRIVPRSYDEWGKLDQKLSRELNSDNENDEDDDDDNDENEKTKKKPRPSDQIHEKSQRLQMAEQHRLNGNTAFKSNNYQNSIDLYTNSIMLDNTNPVVYMNRAIAYYKLNNYDASITDCSHILSNDPHHIKALYRRASCFLAKKQYDEAKHDLDILLTVDQDNNEAKNLIKTIPNIQKPKGVRIPITEDDGDDEEVNIQPSTSAPVKIPILEVEEDEEEEEEESQQVINESTQSMNIDIPQKTTNYARPCIDSQESSPAMFDSHFHHRDDINPFQHNIHSDLSPINTETTGDDEEDGFKLGDEANPDFIGNMSDDDGNNSPSVNVSPTEDDDDVPDLIDQKPLQTPPLISPTRQTINNNLINESISYTMNETYNRKEHSTTSNNQLKNNIYDNNIPTISNNYSSYKQNSTSTNLFENRNNFDEISSQQRSSTINSYNDQIINSNFCPTIQNWLRDLVTLPTNQRLSSLSEKLWSKSSRPSTLDKLQRDIDRFNRLNNFKYAIDASKKMLKNGVLDYHKHADHIVSTLVTCAQSYLKYNDYIHTIQYATEALQYNKTDTNALNYRAIAFENENFLLFSYADYARISSKDFNYSVAQRACEKLSIKLKATEGETWHEKLPQNNNDDECYLTYIKNKDNYSDNDQYQWYRSRGNQLYLDACFILAIQCYTYCIELKPDIAFPYTNRAACYLKVFEPQKTINDCNKALEIDSTNVRALYRKACAYNMLSNKQLYISTLKDLIKLQPNNQTILNEYYTHQHEQIPRQMRRLRTNLINTNNTNTSVSSSSTDINNLKSTMIIEENSLSYEELEQIRGQKILPFSTNTRYQFTQQLDSLKLNDIKSQCSLILRLPEKGLFKIINSATKKLVEAIINTCRIMIYSEKHYQQEHKSSILPYSYIRFCYNILIELTTLPRIDLELSMLDQNYRALLDDILLYYSSLPSIFNDVNKLDRLRK